MKYAFIKAHQTLFRVRVMCRVLKVHHSGFYAWLKSPLSNRGKDDQRLTALIKEAWLESGCVYGYRKLGELHKRRTQSNNLSVCHHPSISLIPILARE